MTSFGNLIFYPAGGRPDWSSYGRLQRPRVSQFSRHSRLKNKSNSLAICSKLCDGFGLTEVFGSLNTSTTRRNSRDQYFYRRTCTICPHLHLAVKSISISRNRNSYDITTYITDSLAELMAGKRLLQIDTENNAEHT